MSKSRTDPGSRKTAVVIPYYQEEAGILRGAVESALSQEGVSDLEIIVVDDGSPAPARDDLQGLDLPAHVTLKLIEQPNRGPGAARNRALDAVSPGTIYVAFLDSDDTWTPNHLSNAQLMLNAGYDFYFSDATTLRQDKSYLDVMVSLHRHLQVDSKRNFYHFVGSATVDVLSSKVFCYPSTVVYPYNKFNELRFIEFAWLGEDWNFWLDLIRGSSRIGFCANIECFVGHGVHVGSTVGWGNPRCIWGLYQYMKCRKWLASNGALGKKESFHNRKQMSVLREQFVVALLHELRIRRGIENRDILRFIILDPLVLLHFFPVLMKVATRKLRHPSY